MKFNNVRFTKERGSIMRVTYRAVSTALSAGVVGMLLATAASACALGDQPGPLATQQLFSDAQNPMGMATFSSLAHEQSDASSANSASIVGMWSFQLISEGNTTRNPSIADGAQLNFGYIQFHSDNTEIQNAGARSPAQQNFCLGVWQKTGHNTYQVNHFALNYNGSTGVLIGRNSSLIETLTLSPGGTSFLTRYVCRKCLRYDGKQDRSPDRSGYGPANYHGHDDSLKDAIRPEARTTGRGQARV